MNKEPIDHSNVAADIRATTPIDSLRKLNPERPIWIQVGQILDGQSTPLKNAHLVYDKDEILFVGASNQTPPAENLKPGQSAPDCILENHTALPGLIDGHTHIFLEGAELDFEKRKAYQSQNADALLQASEQRCRQLVAHGIIAMRDGGDKDNVGLRLSQYRTEAPFAQVFSPGPGINRIKRYGRFFCEPVEGFETAKQVVDDRVARGADHIKIVPTGIINFAKAAVVAKPQFSIEQVQAIAIVAHQRSKHIMAHASGEVGIRVGIEGGVDTIEHGFFITDEQLQRMRDLNTTWVPTFAPVQKQVDHAEVVGWGDLERDNLQIILCKHANSLQKALALGVRVLVGSDAGSYGVGHAEGLFYEMELLENAGMPSLEVINASTGGNAETLLNNPGFGRLAAGQKSRFILTEYDPLKSVVALKKEKTVVFDKRIFNSSEANPTSF